MMDVPFRKFAFDGVTRAQRYYTDLTKEDIAYIESVMRYRVDEYGAMIRAAAARAMKNTVVKHTVFRRDNDIINQYQIKRKGNKFRGGSLGEGVYFYGSREESENAIGYGVYMREFYINVTKPYEMHVEDHAKLSQGNDAELSAKFSRIVNGDEGDYDAVFFPSAMREEWCVLKQGNIKLASATRDDNGVIIPLSYRFDLTNPDVRF